MSARFRRPGRARTLRSPSASCPEVEVAYPPLGGGGGGPCDSLHRDHEGVEHRDPGRDHRPPPPSPARARERARQCRGSLSPDGRSPHHKEAGAHIATAPPGLLRPCDGRSSPGRSPSRPPRMRADTCSARAAREYRSVASTRREGAGGPRLCRSPRRPRPHNSAPCIS